MCLGLEKVREIRERNSVYCVCGEMGRSDNIEGGKEGEGEGVKVLTLGTQIR